MATLLHMKPAAHYLQQRDFAAMVFAAIVLHLAMLLGFLLWPRPEVVEIPLRTLDITLGEDLMLETTAQKASSAAAEISETLARPAVAEPVAENSEPTYRTPAAKPEPKPEPKPQAAKLATTAPAKAPQRQPVTKPNPATGKARPPEKIRINGRSLSQQQSIPANIPTQVVVPRINPSMLAAEKKQAQQHDLVNNPYQYVRSVRGAGEANASPIGGQASHPPAGQPEGEASAKQIRARYEQKISAWLQTHRVMPPMAKQLGQHGTPILRVRLDRKGMVKYFAVDRSTGYQLIDEAAMDMVRRANPFPAPPEDYPGSGLMEFLIPVQFALQ